MSINIFQYQTFPFFHSPFHHLRVGFIRCSTVFILRHEDSNHKSKSKPPHVPRTPLWRQTWLTRCWDLFPRSHHCHATTRGRESSSLKGPTTPTHRGQATTKGPQLPCQDTRSSWTGGKKTLHHLLSCQVYSGIAGPGMVTAFPCLMMPQACTDPKPPRLFTNHY